MSKIRTSAIAAIGRGFTLVELLVVIAGDRFRRLDDLSLIIRIERFLIGLQ